MKKPFVTILLEDGTDLPPIRACIDVLRGLDVMHEVKIASAHRTPKATHDHVADAESRGCAVFICASSAGNHLAASVSGASLKPVISLATNDNPPSTSCHPMPDGHPVAIALNNQNSSKNAGYLAAQMLAMSNIALAQRLRKDRESNAQALVAQDAMLQDALSQGR